MYTYQRPIPNKLGHTFGTLSGEAECPSTWEEAWGSTVRSLSDSLIKPASYLFKAGLQTYPTHLRYDHVKARGGVALDAATCRGHNRLLKLWTVAMSSGSTSAHGRAPAPPTPGASPELPRKCRNATT